MSHSDNPVVQANEGTDEEDSVKLYAPSNQVPEVNYNTQSNTTLIPTYTTNIPSTPQSQTTNILLTPLSQTTKSPLTPQVRALSPSVLFSSSKADGTLLLPRGNNIKKDVEREIINILLANNIKRRYHGIKSVWDDIAKKVDSFALFSHFRTSLM